MISKQEIIDLSREFSLEAKMIEKDYVLGWLLAGINKHPFLQKPWIFKGGTCLKKCYFETYRFSEDLDYTLLDPQHLNEDFLIHCFQEISQWLYEETGIEIPRESIRFEIYRNSMGKVSAEGRLYYVGPLQRRSGSLFRIKLDLTADEIVVLPPVLREVHHPYSDKPSEGIQAHCYHFLELFAEKIRALSERARPRDLYDVIHLYRHAISSKKSIAMLEVLKKKCHYKALPLPTFQLLENHPKLNELEKEWANMLVRQLPVLPEKIQFWQELPAVFDWLHGDKSKAILNIIPLPHEENINLSWQPPSMIQAWQMKIPLELIRYASANYLCIDIKDKNGTHCIEPYDLKKTQQDTLLLIGIKHETGDYIYFQIDEIQKITITPISFTSRYLITLTPFTYLF